MTTDELRAAASALTSLPQVWANDKERRDKVHVPTKIRFQTEMKIAVNLLNRTGAAGKIRFDWVTADETFGRNGTFLDDLEARSQRYVVEVPVNTTVWTVDPATQVPPHQGNGSVNEHVYYRCGNDVPGPSHPRVRWKAQDLEQAVVNDLARLRIP